MPEITVARLTELEQKERAHDDYLEGMKTLRDKSAQMEREQRNYPRADGFGAMRMADRLSGYRRCLRDLSEAIVEAAGKRVAHG